MGQVTLSTKEYDELQQRARLAEIKVNAIKTGITINIDQYSQTVYVYFNAEPLRSLIGEVIEETDWSDKVLLTDDQQLWTTTICTLEKLDEYRQKKRWQQATVQEEEKTDV